MLNADLKAEFSQALPEAVAAKDADTCAIMTKLEAQAYDWFTEEDVDPARQSLRRVALMRYHGQGGELAIEMGGDPAVDFAKAHRALYGFTLEAEVELVTIRVEATGHAAEHKAPDLALGHTVTPVEHTQIAGAPVPIVERASLGAGARLDGPMIVTQLDTTTLIAADWTGLVQQSGAILLTRKDAS